VTGVTTANFELIGTSAAQSSILGVTGQRDELGRLREGRWNRERSRCG
jgi:hypothetical protein